MLRLTGGKLRGQSIQTPPQLKARPTQAKTRQALFNSIQADIPDAKVLDLFAGSGALGFEALSRGAKEVHFVEKERTHVRVIEENARHLKVQKEVRIHLLSVEKAWKNLSSFFPFDLVLADPPYGQGFESLILETWPWESILVPGGLFCIEWSLKAYPKDQRVPLPESFSVMKQIREKAYGDTLLTTFERQ